VEQNRIDQLKYTLARYVDRYDRYIFPAPAIILVTAILLFPVAFTVYLSFHRWSGGITPPAFVGFDNYIGLLQDQRFLNSLKNTVYFVSLSIVSQLALGLISALIFHRVFWGRGLARTLFMFPMIATPSAMALVWKMMLDPTIGSLGYIIESLGGPEMLWVADAKTVIPSLVMVDTWQWTPLVMLIILSGLAALPLEPYESAKVDGASAIQTFIYITLPLLRPTLVIAAMFRIIDCIKTFDIIMVITGGGPAYASEILNVYAFNESLTYLHFGSGSTLLVVLTIIVVIVAIFFNRIRRGGYWS
jgi:multiple sugar transport system permease protein